MGEHDDDLESEVQEDSDEETDTFPATDEEFEEEKEDDDLEEVPEVDPDETELLPDPHPFSYQCTGGTDAGSIRSSAPVFSSVNM
jgi:hypothetical protein